MQSGCEQVKVVTVENGSSSIYTLGKSYHALLLHNALKSTDLDDDLPEAAQSSHYDTESCAPGIEYCPHN